MKRAGVYSVVDRLTILTLLAVAAWMVLAAGRYSVFDDEAFSLRRYELPMGTMVRDLWTGVEPDPPLYYILQNLALRVTGTSPLGLRAVSIVMFLAGLIALRAAGNAWFGDRAGRLAMLLAAMHPAHLFFGFAARWYSTMFCAAALLLWVTGRRVGDLDYRDGTTSARCAEWWPFAWAVAAAAVCYVNYFGPVIVGLTWLVAVTRSQEKKHWLYAMIAAVLLYAPWLPAFWRAATTFPEFGGSAASMLATMGRTLLALCAGNLASPRAWWVWGPMTAFGILLAARAWQERQRAGPIVLIVIGCFAAGVVSRTMIDKYVMTFSSFACLMMAALLSKRRDPSQAAANRIRRACIGALALAWLGCGVNLVTERHWSSLRWLDPWDTALTQAVDTLKASPDGILVATHPSAGYYLRRANAATPIPPTDAVQRVARDVPSTVVTVETAGFTSDEGRQRLHDVLEKEYHVTGEDNFLHDAESEWKDRVDPRYEHPRWRITVRSWARNAPGA